MIKKYVCFALVGLLLTVNSSVISAQTRAEDTLSSAAKIKTVVLKRGTGENKRVEVQTLDGAKLKGYISQAGENSFTLIDSKTKQPSVIAYSDVAKVKNKSSRGDKIALGIIGGAAAVAAVVVISLVVLRCRNEGGC